MDVLALCVTGSGVLAAAYGHALRDEVRRALLVLRVGLRVR